MDRSELTELVRRIWFDDMSPADRTALKQTIGERLGLPHAHVVGCIDFDDESESPEQVADALLAQAGGGGGCRP